MMDYLTLLQHTGFHQCKKIKMQIEKMILIANKDKIKTPNQPEN